MKGIRNLDLDVLSQVEYNRQKNVTQDSQIQNLSSQVSQLLAQNPAGFLPRVMFAYTRLAQTYRFNLNATFEVSMTDAPGTAYELTSSSETAGRYIPAVAVMQEDSTIKIIVKGDYIYSTDSFTAVNMTNGTRTSLTLNNSLFLQDASYLGDYPAEDNKNKQITVLYNLEVLADNTMYASLDLNNDGVYNWVEIGDFVDGIDGKSIVVINSENYSSVTKKTGDTMLAGETFSNSGHDFVVGGLYRIDSNAPLRYTYVGNIRGAQGATGADGQDGTDGTKVISDSGVPSNDIGENGDTYIDTSTWNVYTKENGSWTSVGNIKGADGQNGTDGQNGQSFQMQSGLYSVPANWGQTGNVDPEGNALLQLPTLPQSDISGKGYVVFDPLTTPLAPFYDLYYANNGDVAWTIIHPFSGIAGQDGTDGETPYISGGTWWIGSTNTGVAATGPQGPAGPGVPSGGTTGQVLKKKSNTDYDTEWGAGVNSSDFLQLNNDNVQTTNSMTKISYSNTSKLGLMLDYGNYGNYYVIIKPIYSASGTLLESYTGSVGFKIHSVLNKYQISHKPSGTWYDLSLPEKAGTLALTSDCKKYVHNIYLYRSDSHIYFNIVNNQSTAMTISEIESYISSITDNYNKYSATGHYEGKLIYGISYDGSSWTIQGSTINTTTGELNSSTNYSGLSLQLGGDLVKEI